MKRARLFLFLLLLLPAPLPAQSQKTLLLGLASISGGIETLYVTKKIGAFKRNGLDVDFLLLQGGSQIAISRFGSSSDFAARFMVSRLGLDPAKDVTIMQIGNQRERMGALLSGSVDGSVVDAPNTLIARQQGFVELADASKLGLTYPHNNIATTDRFVREEPQTVFAFLRAFVEEIAFYRTHKAESIQMIKEFLRVSDNAIAEEAYDYYSRITPAKPYPSADGVRTVLDEIAVAEPAIKNAKVEQFIDGSFIAKLDQSGFIDGLYKKKLFSPRRT